MSVQPYPPLVFGKLSDWIEIRGKPEADLLITPGAMNGDVTFIPEKVQIRFVPCHPFMGFYLGLAIVPSTKLAMNGRIVNFVFLDSVH